MSLSSIKNAIRSNHFLSSTASYIYRLFGFNTIRSRGDNNVIDLKVSGLFLSQSKIKIRGNNNTIRLGSGISYIKRLSIIVYGDNNLVEIGTDASCDGLTICIENNNNEVLLGERFRCGINTELAAIEGTSIVFGKDCMLSANISIRTGDSHSIVDFEGNRINQSRSVIIGEHTWIGNTVHIFKGTEIGHNSIVAGGAIVTGKQFPPFCIIGGNPAKVIKENH